MVDVAEIAESPQNEYDITAKELHEIFLTRDKKEIETEYGSVDQLLSKLFSHKLKGLTQARVEKSRKQFGRNKVEPPPPKSFLYLMWDAFKDLTMMILFFSSIVSIILTTTVKDPSELEWIDGVAILGAVFIVIMVIACNNYSKERQYRKLNAVKNNKIVKVLRDGKYQEISVFDIVVGDIVCLETGDQIPADGIVICSTDLRVDESGMTGETDEIKKSPDSPFLVGSCLVTAGSGRQLITGVGIYSVYGDILSTL